MFYLSELLRAAVYDSSGKKVGRVSEVAASTTEKPPRICFLLLKDGQSADVRSIPWAEVGEIDRGQIRLRISEDRLGSGRPDESFLLLRNDLLDQQIIDVNGRKVVRVNDLLLEKRSSEQGSDLLLSAVDIGLGGALRRLLQGTVPHRWLRRLEGRVKQTIIPWNFVDLIEEDPHRRVKLHISHQMLGQLHPADIADIMEELSAKERSSILSALDDATVAEILPEIRPRLRKSILDAVGLERASDIIEEMEPDDAADVLAELPEATTEDLLEDMDEEEAAEIEELLEFSEDSAGGRMTTGYVALPHTADVESARLLLRDARDAGELPEQFNTVFLVDESGLLMGSVSLVRLLVADPQDILDDLKSGPLISIEEEATETDVIEMFDKYNLLSLAVVDDQMHLTGVVTVDDVVSILHRK